MFTQAPVRNQSVISQIESTLGCPVKEIREWAFVWWVRPCKGRCTMVSKKKVKQVKKSLSPAQAVAVINQNFKFADSRCQAVLWEKGGLVRLYLNAVDRPRHLQKNGYIEYRNGVYECSNVTGFGSYQSELSALLNN